MEISPEVEIALNVAANDASRRRHEYVTIEHLLAHRSGIGDYLDEEAGHEVTDYVLTAPPHELATTEQYLAVLGGHPAKFPPGERFCYCNSGYVVLALIAERVSGVAFPELVAERVCRPAGMAGTGFLRSDELPAGTALGYLPLAGRSRTNVFHLPVRGSGPLSSWSSEPPLPQRSSNGTLPVRGAGPPPA